MIGFAYLTWWVWSLLMLLCKMLEILKFKLHSRFSCIWWKISYNFSVVVANTFDLLGHWPLTWAFLGAQTIKNLPAVQAMQCNAVQCRRCKIPRFYPWLGKIPWRRKWKPTSVLLPGEFIGRIPWNSWWLEFTGSQRVGPLTHDRLLSLKKKRQLKC